MNYTTKTINVKGRAIGPGEPIFLTAEIGSAHEGDFERCKHLMRVAKEAGCDGTDVFWIDPETYVHQDVGLEGQFEMETIVRNVRRVEQAMGQGSTFTICRKDGTLPPGNVWRRKVLVCAHDIAAGDTLSRGDFMAKRPGSMGGLHPWYGELLHGATAKVDMPKNTRVDLNMVENIPLPFTVLTRCPDGVTTVVIWGRDG